MDKGYNPNLLPKELSEGLPEALRDPDVPAYMRVEYRRRSTIDGLVGAVQEQLNSGKETYIRGGDGVFISEAQFNELRGLRVTIRGKGPNFIVHMPSPEDVARIFEGAYQAVDGQLPDEYQEEARQKLKPMEPKFAGTLEEAAAAFGAVLPTKPQE